MFVDAGALSMLPSIGDDAVASSARAEGGRRSLAVGGAGAARHPRPRIWTREIEGSTIQRRILP